MRATTHRPAPRNALLALTGCLAILALLFLFNFKLFLTSGPSMEPTYTEGTWVMAHRRYADPKNDDLVFLLHNGYYCLKRVAFIAGEDVSPHGYEGYWGSNVVPEGYVFVLGDNAAESADSRDPKFGLVKISDIWGMPVSPRQKGE